MSVCQAGGGLQAIVERSLASSLAGPLHEALRNNFDTSLIPAFERATRVSSSCGHEHCWCHEQWRTAGQHQQEGSLLVHLEIAGRPPRQTCLLDVPAC